MLTGVMAHALVAVSPAWTYSQPVVEYNMPAVVEKKEKTFQWCRLTM